MGWLLDQIRTEEINFPGLKNEFRINFFPNHAIVENFVNVIEGYFDRSIRENSQQQGTNLTNQNIVQNQ